MKGICEICASKVEDTQTAAYPVTGWEVERYAGGANHITLRERLPNRVVHAVCLEGRKRRRKQGIGDDQGSFL